MAKWVAAEKARAGLRHAVVCPNVTGKTKEKIVQSKRARVGSLTILVSHKWRELAVPSGRFFVLFFVDFYKAATLRSIVLRSSICMHAPRQPHAVT